MPIGVGEAVAMSGFVVVSFDIAEMGVTRSSSSPNVPMPGG